MDIFMVVFLAIVDVIMIWICWAVYRKMYQYKDGMLFGVHIPATKIYREDVQEICRKGRRQWSQVSRRKSGFQSGNYIFLFLEI